MSARKIVVIAAAAMGAAMVCAPVAAAEAHTGAASAGQPGTAAVFTHRLRPEGTSLCLDAPSSGGELQLVTCTPGSAQQWRWSSPGRTSLRHELSGRCAERVPGGPPVRVRSAGCSSNPVQMWNVGHRQGHVVIKAADSTQCLARDLRGVAMRPCADTPGQRWQTV